MNPITLPGRWLVFGGIIGLFSTVSSGRAEPPTLLESSPPTIAERGAHHRTWKTVVPKIASSGKTYFQTNEVIELQTGLHRQTPEGWVETNPRVELIGGRGVVQGLQYSAVFPGNGAIELTLPEGNALKGSVFGVAFIDGDQSVLLAESKESVGEISGTQQNIVTFRDAFTDFEADVQFVVERGKVSQSLIIKSRVPDPTGFGLSDNAVLTLLTEFTEFPNPQKAPRVWQGEGAVRDEQIGLGIMQFGTGRAFKAGAEADQSWLVGKTWEQLRDEAGNARTFLLEQIAWKSIRSETEKLPLQARNGGAAIQRMARKGLVLPVRKHAQAPPRPIQMAAAERRLGRDDSAHRGGFVLDYELLVTTNYFEFGPKTYYVNGQFNIVTNKWFGGAVLKYAPTNNAKITITGPILNYATNGHPIHFVGRDDHSVGEQIGTNVLSGTYASNALVIDAITAGQSSALSHLRIANALVAIQYLGGTSHTLSHAQIVNCQRAFEPSPAQFWLKNCLIYNSSNVIAGSQVSTCRMENVTIHLAQYLNAGGACSNLATNTLFAAVTNLGTWWGNHVQTTNSDTGVFLSQSFGHHYLPTNSPFRSATTTTNLSTGLYDELKLRSTHAPMLVATNLTGTNVLGPYVARDAQTIGYHYEALDYILRGITFQGVLIATNGVGIGLEFGATNYGLRAASGGHTLISEGKPVNLNLWVRTHAIQESPTGTNLPHPSITDTYAAGGSLPKIIFRFTDLPMMAGSFLFNQQNNSGAIGSMVFKDSQVRGGNIYLSPGNDGQAMRWTNSLFERVMTTIYPYSPTVVSAQNCLFKEGKLTLYPINLSGTSWAFYQNQFDKTIIHQDANGTIDHGWNAYLVGSNRLTPHSEADLVTNFVFETGPLGRYYQPVGSPLIDRCSKYASEVGLYHYGTVIGFAETNTILDLGLHYIVLNAQGEPEDSNVPTNGIPNYVEDANGNGIVDSGETPYTTVLASITSPANNASFNQGESISLSASASAAFSTITWVEFYIGTNLLAQDTAAPYSFAWNNLPAGIHTLTARARANAGIFATSAPVTIAVHGAVFLVGDTNLSSSDNAIKSRLEALKLYPLVVDDSQSLSNDANGKRLIVISGSVTPGNVGTKFTYHRAPILCWQEALLDDLKMTGPTANTDYGSTTGQEHLLIMDGAHPMATNLSGTVAITTTGSEFSWGVPGSNAVKVARLTNSSTRFGIFGYESNAMMVGLEAPARRAGFFLGDVNMANLATNGWRLFDAAVHWATETNLAPTVSWVAPTNESTFVASTNVNLAAIAGDLDSGVKKVNFYRTGVRIGQADTVVSQTNYSLVWSNAIAGNHVLTARAIDQGGLVSTSAQVIAVTVLSNALFITGAPTLNAGETNLKARIESLGFIVTTRAATNVSTADAFGKTVVVISSTAAAADLTNKLTYTPTPVVVWQKDLFDDLGMTGTGGSDSGVSVSETQLSIITDHSLAGGLTGLATLTASAAGFTWGAPGTNAIAAATIVGDAAKIPIFGYEKGAVMVGVGTNTLAAPARRVGIFLTSDTATVLTSDGWKLFDAAILWAVAKPCSTSVVVMLAMDVSQSLSVTDFLRSQKAASNFVNFLAPTIDRVGLVSFASNSILESAITTNLSAVQVAIMGLTIRGGTLLEPPITMCQSNLATIAPGPARLLILLSDGEINQSVISQHRSNALNAATVAKNAGTRIVTIAYDTNALGLELLQGIASSAADYYYSPDIPEFGDVYGSVADTICRFDSPPNITITNPIAGATYLPPASIPIHASATDEHGQVVQVEFFEGNNDLNVDPGLPWSFTWTNVPTGHYTLTAVARDNAGLSATSAPVSIIVTNFPPVVLMTSPTNGTFFAIPPTNVTLSATATDPDGHITHFVFFVGTTPINVPVFTNGSSYSVDWWPLFSGTNVITARAIDNRGATTTSPPITFSVNHPPLISITNPIHPGVAMTPNNTITIAASALDVEASGSVTQVQFFRGELLLGIDFSAPYSVVWNNAPTGTYVLAAKATDNHGATRTSTGVNITVHPANAAPFVDAGDTQVVRLPAVATLVGRATDDGLPPGSELQINWAKVSGPGTVTFSNASLASTTVSFSTSGVYKLVLSASDSQFMVTNDMFVVVQAANIAPNVHPGPDQMVVMGAQVPFLSSTNASLPEANPNSRGKEFWLCFPQNAEPAMTPFNLALLVTGEKDTWVNVTASDINFATNLTLAANDIVTIDIPPGAEIVDVGKTNKLGIHVTSKHEVTVYGLSQRPQTTDAFLALPVDILGTNYIVLGYSDYSFRSQFAVVATRKGTAITITPTASNAFGPAGQSFLVHLDAGETFQLRAVENYDDLSGSLVVSDKPIALFAGHQCSYVPSTHGACDYLVEAIPPVSAWGSNFVTMPLALRQNGDRFRVISALSNTVVKANGVSLVTLTNRAEFFEFTLDARTYVTANKPVLLAQYATGHDLGGFPGDPFMQLISPTEQFLSSYTVRTPASGFGFQFINVVCPTGIVGQVKLDGTNLWATNFVTITNSGFAGSQVAITNGAHQLEAPLPFGAFVYGFDSTDSYGYPGGMALSEIANAASLVLSPNPATNQFFTTRCVLASVSDSASLPLPGLRVEFQVTGPNANGGYAVTEANGVARFCYFGGSVGTDVIEASVGNVSAKATNYWVQPFAWLAGSISDPDGLPSGVLTSVWENVSGPGPITFSPSNTVTNAQARIPKPGVYVLGLKAGDSNLVTSSNMTLTAIRNQAPLVFAGTGQAFKGEVMMLDGSATDDGLPVNPLSVNWTALNQPGNVTFSNASQPQTHVSFTSPGVYNLRLGASDGDVEITSDVTITNLPETISLVCDQTVSGVLSTLDREAVGRVGARADFYRFTVPKGLVVIEMVSTNVDSFLSLYTKDLHLIANDDDSLQTNNAKLVCMLPHDGEFILEASSSLTNQTGAYTVRMGCGALPHVRITAPADGTVLTNAQIVPIAIAAYDADGIDFVDLYRNGTLLTTIGSAPYETSFYFDEPGMHTLLAVAQDGNDNRATSAPVVIRVIVPLLTLGPANVCAGIPGTQHTITATLRDNFGAVAAGTNIQFSVSGANSASGSQTTDAAGQASFTYTGTNTGFDQITASATVAEGLTTASGGKSWARALACNQVTSGALTSVDQLLYPYKTYADYFWFNAVSNDYAVVSLQSTNFDTFLSVYDIGCTLLASNDDFQTTDSQLGLTITNTGLYLVEVTSFQSLTTGAYSLLMECITPTAQPEIAVFLGPTELPNYGLIEFGVTTNGIAVHKVLTITNRGDRQLVIDNVLMYGDFSSTNGTNFSIAAGAAASFTVRFNAATNGSHSSYIAFYNDDGDGGDGLERPFVLNLTAVCNAGTPPTVTLTAPANSTIVQLPANVVLTATASTGSGSITNVEFVARKGDRLYLIGSDASSPYSMTNYPSAGSYVLTAIARDSNGRIGVSIGVNLEVKAASTNNPPVAVQDYLSVLANSTDNILSVLDNDTDAELDPLTITSVFDLHGGQAEVINNGGSILYIPPYGIRGGDYFRYTITDGQGGFASSVVNVAIDATDAPTVQIVTPPQNATLTAGTATNIQALVTPADFQGAVEFFFHDHKIGQTSAPPYTVSWIPIEDPCNCGLKAVATDVFGQIFTSDPVMVNIVPPSGDAAPIARIANLMNEIVSIPGHKYSRAATVREGLFELFGDAYDTDSSPVRYKVRIFNSERELVRDVTPSPVDGEGFRLGPVNNGSLGVLDLSLVDNGLYDLELTVRAGYRQSSTNVRFALESDLKIGHFSFSEQDLVLPVNGFPLTITRTYNSLNLKKADFGRSWTFAFSDLQLELDEDRALVESLFENEGDETVEPSGQFFSMRVGGERNVTLTLPDGRRTTFYYYLEATSCDSSKFKFCAWPRWVAGPGVFAQLRAANDVKLAMLPWSSGMTWWTDDGSSNPDSYEFPGYILTMQDGTEYRIDRDHKGEKFFVLAETNNYYANVYGAARLTEIKSRSGDKIVIGANRIDHRNPSDQLTRSIWLQRDEENRIIAINDPISGANGVPVVKYDYAGDNLIRVHRLVDRATSNYLTTTYAYTNRTYPHYITGITDPRGIQVARNMYDLDGRLIGIIDADDHTNTFMHDLVARAETITNRLGDRTIHAYDLRGNIVQTIDALGFNTYRGYDTTNNLIWEANHLNQTNWFFYDTNRFLIATRNPLGHTNGTVYNTNGQVMISFDALGRGTTNHYDVKGNVTSTIDALGIATTFLYDDKSRLTAQIDALGTVTTNTYDSVGNLTHTVVRNAALQVLSTNSYAYDVNGNRTNQTVTRTLPDGTKQAIVTTYIYDGQSRVVQTIEPDGYTNSVVYNAIGQHEFTIDKLGRTNRFEYDAQGRMFRHTFPDGALEQTFYDAEGRRTNSLDRAGRPTTYIYDPLGRLTHTIHADGANSQTVYDVVGRVQSTIDARGTVTAFGYDAAGRRTSVTNAYGIALQAINRYGLDTVGNLTNMVDALGRATDYEYDQLNRQVRTIYPATVSGGQRTATLTAYDVLGRRIAETNEANVVTRFGYDALGRLTAVTNAHGHPEAAWATYAYDEAGNQTNQIDALDRITRYDCDQLGRKISRTLPGNQKESFAYDPMGSLLRHTNFINTFIITNEYDVMNRLVRKWSDATLLESYGYSVAGQRTTRSDASGNYSWVYDIRDRLRTNNTPAGTLYYVYDANGNLIDLRSSTLNGAWVTYQYDALNRVTNVIDNRLSGSKNTAYMFDLAGNLKTLKYPNSVTNLWDYDTRNRLTNETWKLSTTALASFYYQLAVTGNRTNLTETIDNVNRTYSWSYDKLHRLTNEAISSLGSLSYAFDRVSNRTNRSGTLGPIGSATYAYNTNDWLTTDNYDANGNTTNSASVAYAYDWANRLTNSGSISIAYNADGHRMQKTTASTTTLFLIDERNLTGYAQVLEELTVSGGLTNLAKAYTYGLDLISQRQGNGTIHFYGYDGHGSVRFLISTNGTLTDSYAYDAYGTLVASNGSTANLYLYTGEQFDPDLGFYFLRARYLNADIGRFWTMDILDGNQQDASSLHKYLYAHGNPVAYRDPSGTFSVTEMLTVSFQITVLATKMYASYQVGHLIGTAIRFTYDEEMLVEELVDEALKTGLTIGGGWVIGKGATFAFSRWIGPIARKLTPVVWQRVRDLGAAGEALVMTRYNLFRNSKTLAELGGKGDFIPDAISKNVMREVKNVGRLQLDAQIKAFAEFCKHTSRQFIIHVRKGAKIDSTVVKEMEKQFGPGTRGTRWEILDDIPESMRIVNR